MFKEVTPPPIQVTRYWYARGSERKPSGSVPVEELSITQVLKDLELVLELEIAKDENRTPTEEATFSSKTDDCTLVENTVIEVLLEGEPVDKEATSAKKNQRLWHTPNDRQRSISQCEIKTSVFIRYIQLKGQSSPRSDAFRNNVLPQRPEGHSGQSDILTSVSPTEIKHYRPESHFSYDNNVCLKGENLIHGKPFIVGSQAISSTELQFFEDFSVLKDTKGNNSPCCSSPCLPEEINIFQETGAKNEKCISPIRETIKEPLVSSENVGIDCNSDSDECSSEDNESTIEQPTLLAVALSCFPEDVGTLQTTTDWKLQHQLQHCKKIIASLPQLEDPAESTVKENLDVDATS
ncbi:hypothetical protein XELAEV_18027112mg [Xenopus laevis]|uniref:Uncharacterized protein n=1 Tax=Xenopus laevis TaxID=8355 RepID=A0A974CUY1_XENLA|nr:hypothetical protein XELAEV_18027112mg [Xenopus laevis]